MDYRNERDALRGRVERLEQELDDARRELAEARRIAGEAAAEGSRAEGERLARLEAAMPEAEALIHKLRGELAAVEMMHVERRAALQDHEAGGGEAPEPRLPRAARRRWSALLALAVVPVIAGGAVLVQRYRVHEREQREQEERALQTCQNAFACCLRNNEPGDPLCKWAVTHCDDYVQQRNCPRPPPLTGVVGKLHASWRGRVLSTEGNAPPPGTECMVEAVFEGSAVDMRLELIRVTCGGELQFTAPGELMLDAADGAISTRGRATHIFLDGVEHEQTVEGVDWHGRSAIGAALQRGAVWRDASPTSRVELAIRSIGDCLFVDEALLDGGGP